MRRLFTNIGWLLGGRAVNAALSLIYLALATRTLGLEAFGQFVLIVALGQTVTGLANFQTWQFIMRWGSGEDGPAEATGFAIALDCLSVGLGIVLTTALIYLASVWLPLPADLLPIAFAFCVVSLLSIRTTPTGLLRLRFRYAATTAADAVQPVTRTIGALLALAFMPSVTGFIIAWAVSELAVAATYWWIAARAERIDMSRISLFALPRKHTDAWRFVWATNMSGSLAVGGKQVMILLVGAIGGEALAGGFRVASQLGQALIQLAQAVSKAIYPELVEAKDNAAAMAGRMARIAMIGGAIAVGVAIVFGEWVLTVIAGAPFVAVYWAMVILAVRRRDRNGRGQP